MTDEGGEENNRISFLERIDQVFTPVEIKNALIRNKLIWSSSDNKGREIEINNWAQEIKTRIEDRKPVLGNKPEVSVVIPARNEEKNILQLLDTLSMQVNTNGLEIMVVANNCSDRTASLARMCGVEVVEYSNLPSNMRNVNKIALARQIGVERVTGETVLFTDADALVPRTWVQALTEPLLRKNKNIALVTGDVLFFERGEKPFLILYDFARSVLRRKDRVLSARGSNMAVRKSDLMDIGGFDFRMATGEDWYLGKQMSEKGEVLFTNDSRAAIRVSPRRVIETGPMASLHQRFPKVVKSSTVKYGDLLPTLGKNRF